MTRQGIRDIRLTDAQVDAIQDTLDTMRNDEKPNHDQQQRRRCLMKQNPEVRPAFTLMKLNDAISHFHMQMPRWLFPTRSTAACRWKARWLTRSCSTASSCPAANGWVNRHGEVYVIYTREDLAREMQVSYRKGDQLL